MIYFIGDTHFNHKNIIAYTSRQDQMTNLDEMHQIIIERWNSVVTDEDIVYFLGDFGFGGSRVFHEFLPQLNGQKIIIIGNHDPKKSQAWYLERGFIGAFMHPIILENWFILSHEPIGYLTERMPYVNIHGHTHDECYTNPQRINVSWEVLNGYPVSFEDIKARFAQLDGLNQNVRDANKDRHKNGRMNYAEGYLAGKIDGRKEK